MLRIDNPKRGANRSHEHLYDYYAGFSPTFASELLRSLPDRASTVVLDPWNGAGTTTEAAARLGRRAIGIDLNPAMRFVALAKFACPKDGPKVKAAIADGLRRARMLRGKPLGVFVEPLTAWFEPRTASWIRALASVVGLHESGGAATGEVSPATGLYVAILFRLASRLTERATTSNPTWTKLAGDQVELEFGDLEAALHAEAEQVLSLNAKRKPPDYDLNRHVCIIGNSQHLPVRSSAIDTVLTSPPYCTRIDYAVATARELAVLGLGERSGFAALRSALMGTTTVPRKAVPTHRYWGRTCTGFLDALRKHESKASATYYFKNHVQYFDALFRSLAEIQRVLKPNGFAAVVVQDSYYKDLHNDLPKMIIEMCEGIGLPLCEQASFPVRNSMAALNKGSKRYRVDRPLVETVLCFYKPD